MNLKKFIQANSIREADVVVVKREKFGIFDHFVVFLGFDKFTSEPLFAANYGKYVNFIPNNSINNYLQTYTPVSIRRFKGNNIDRKYAIGRALQEIKSPNKIGYNLIINNCEHFATYVQNGVRESKQVEDFGKGAVLGGIGLIALGASTNKENLVLTGVLASILGGIFMELEK